MSSKHTFFTVLILSIILIFSINHQALAGQKPITVQIADPVEFYAVINPELPLYHFRFLPNPKDNYVGESQYVGRVEIDGPNNIQQSIDVFAHAAAFDFINHYYICDINFDGYTDLGVVESISAKFATYNFLIFDPRSGQFITNHLTQELNQIAIYDLVIDPDTQEIYADTLDVCCPARYIYKVIDNHVVMTAAIEAEITRTVTNDYSVKFTTKGLFNGEMVIVDQWQTVDAEMPEDHMFSFENLKMRYTR
jgi:hypothetical protein